MLTMVPKLKKLLWACTLLLLLLVGSCWLLWHSLYGSEDSQNYAITMLQHSSNAIVQEHKASTVTGLHPCSDDKADVDIRGVRGVSHDARSGYVMAYSIHEQQTKASVNLFALQCWAGLLPLYVVEPFMNNSRLYFPFQSNSTSLRLRDTFNMTIWLRASVQHRYALLASWEYFISDAPRDLIVARFKYGTDVIVSKRKSEGILSSHLTVDNAWKEGCTTSVEFNRGVEYLTNEHNFTVVREVCYNFEGGDELTIHQFNNHLFGRNLPGKVSVLLEQWRGFTAHENGKRVLIYDSQCTDDSDNYAWPSSRLLCEARTYSTKFMENRPYIAIMLRLEKIHKKIDSKGENFISDCLNRTLNMWTTTVNLASLKYTFLAMDYGKYGSTTFTHGQDDKFKRYYEKLYGSIYSGSSLDAWEHSFESVTGIRDAGYVAALQKVLVGGARCIVFAGGGSFQKQALTYYQKMNPSKKRQCIHIVKQCS